MKVLNGWKVQSIRGMKKMKTDEVWLTKVRRYGGGTSILDMNDTKEKAQALADEFNQTYQTDNYYVERYTRATGLQQVPR